MKADKVVKTNAMRWLDKAKVAYQTSHYEVADGDNDGVAVAHKLAISPQIVYKTLVLQSEQAYHVCLLAAERELDLKKTAQAFGVKRIELIAVKDLLPLTGYVKGGCSPIGMKKAFATLIDLPAQELTLIYISAGKIGSQIVISPLALAQEISAQFADLSTDH